MLDTPTFDHLVFDNRLLAERPGDPESGPRRREVRGAVWSRVMPTPVAAPRTLAVSREMAEALGFTEADTASETFAQVFGGNARLPGMDPFATNYGGHQFGHWAGQLGDGRAISLGETVAADGARLELQLKGAGPTPYARFADGRAVLRSSIREFLCSEAMHHLGVPTTRALSLVATGDDVVRDMFYDGHPKPEPGAVVCRVAPSFLRFGHFELPASRGETGLLRALAEFAIRRDFPHLQGEGETRYGDWFAEVCTRTARLAAEWMRVGFVHGVLNTDNMSVLGLTIDYGPYGWIDAYDPDWTPNTTDAGGRRYRFGWQPAIARWNLMRLAQALSPLFGDAAPLTAGIDAFGAAYAQADRDNIARKLGFAECRDDDVALVRDLHALMHAAEIDMTLWFRGLIDLVGEDPAPLEGAFYDPTKRAAHDTDLRAWLARYAARVADDMLSPGARRERMRLANPQVVLRNWLAQQAIDRAEAGDASAVAELLEAMRRPYDDRPERNAFAAKRPEWARDRPGCGALSCSS
ncbi:MAG: protein adenylyltransferase SelO [Lysobacteraceae bacterium]